MRKTRTALLAGLLICAGAYQAWCASVLPVNLVDLVEIAPRVFEGQCVQIEHAVVKSSDGEVDIPVARYTFEVNDPIRGISDKKVTITQLGKFQDGRRFWANPDMIGVPTYKVGDRYVLFMTPEGKTGLSSPVGMAQGAFLIENRRAKSMSPKSYVFKGMQQALDGTPYQKIAQNDEGLDLDQFKALIRDMIERKITAPSLIREVRK